MEKIQTELRKIGIEISEKIQTERIYEKIQWSLSILLLIVLPIGIIISFIQLFLPINLEANIVLLILLISFIFTFFVLLILKKYVIDGIDTILDSNNRILYIDINSIALENTLTGLILIYQNIGVLLQWKKIIQWALFYRENGGKEIERKIEQFIEGELSYTLQLITNLGSDLSIHIQKEQTILESAKSEIESNIKGTTELEKISELQRARLDKQIEQFEELQRVLVKV